MAYLRTWGDIQAWMQDNDIQRWNISRTQATQDNNNVFVYNKDKSEDENKLICERALERFAGDVLYIVGWRTKEAKTGGFSAAILYNRAAQASPAEAARPASGLYGVGGSVDIDKLTADIEQRIHNRYEKERLERMEKDLKEERRSLEAQKNSAIGIIAQTLAPFAQQLAGKLTPMPKVAGIDSEEDVRAARIRVQEEAQEAEEGEENAFTDEEADELLALMERFKKVEPQYIQLLAAVVEMAENGDANYALAKQFLLK